MPRLTPVVDCLKQQIMEIIKVERRHKLINSEKNSEVDSADISVTYKNGQGRREAGTVLKGSTTSNGVWLVPIEKLRDYGRRDEGGSWLTSNSNVNRQTRRLSVVLPRPGPHCTGACG